MDTSIDCEPPRDGVVRWVASQSSNPALQALIREAERDKKARRARPSNEPASWTCPLASSTSLPTPVASPWHNTDATDLLPLSASRASSSAAHRKPLACSASSANQPPRVSTRPRSSSHSIGPPDASMEKYVPREDGPEAMAFVELLRDVSRQLDENSKKKQRLVVRAKEKDRDHSGNRMSVDAHNSGARPLAKTSSASTICSVRSTARALERTSAASDFKLEARGRAMGKTASLGGPGIDLVSGKSTPHSLPSSNLNCDLKPAPAPRPPPRPSNISNADRHPNPNDGGSPMQDVVDITDTDTDWERPMSRSAICADTTTYMQVDDENSDVQMDVSFFRTEPSPQPRGVTAPKPKVQPPQPRPSAPTQRARNGPPPLGMRRAPQLQPSQYSASQATKNLAVPRFKPPLRASSGATNKLGSGAKSTATTSSKPASRGAAVKVGKSQDADSSFDVSFGVDADELEEAMRAYD